MIKRSLTGEREQLNDCIEIISANLIMAKNNKIFSKVLAVQLRILLCDTKFNTENSLINKVIQNPSLASISSNFISYQNKKVIEFISPESLFTKNNPSVSLETWLNQKVIKSNISYKELKDCQCYYCCQCGTKIEMPINNWKINENGCYITKFCYNCGHSFQVNLSEIIKSYEGKIENANRTTITIKDIIKNYANKNGGAHVDSVLDIKGLLIAELGDKYIQAISKYILEYFSETKI
ncbi:hypothetical protein PY144_14890 [Bacillus cereus]|uniref:hypothetical protein n=1 Tax=Bacillus cereus group TaxID=86661 RepID=UPI001F55CA34